MGLELVSLIITLAFLMIMLRLVFAEIDGRTATKRMNLAYFLHFTQKFTLKKFAENAIIIYIINRKDLMK